MKESKSKSTQMHVLFSRLWSWRFLLLVLPFVFGFRVFPGLNRWDVQRSDPTLWVQVCQYPEIGENDLPSDDPLAPQLFDFQTLLQSVFDDYNRVPGSFIRLAFYPVDPDNPGPPADGDSVFTRARSAQRTIDLCFTDQILTSGHARPKIEDGRVVGCEIRLNNKIFQKASEGLATLTHELGHCLGLDHAQETTRAVMSYFSDATRLQIDDKMGLVHLYPAEPGWGDENPNLGLSCSPR